MSSIDFLVNIQSTVQSPNFIFSSGTTKQEFYLKRFKSSWIQVIVEFHKNNKGEILDAIILSEDIAQTQINNAIKQGTIKFALS